MPGTTDTVKAKLTPGEFVIRKEAVDMIGVPMLNKLNDMPEEGGHSAIDNIINMATLSNMKMMYGGGMVKPNYAGGGMVMDQYGHGGMVKNKMMGYAKGGQLKAVPEDNPGLGKLPEMVRNRMGYMQDGGMVEDNLMGMMGGGMAKKKKGYGYQEGGIVGMIKNLFSKKPLQSEPVEDIEQSSAPMVDMDRVLAMGNARKKLSPESRELVDIGAASIPIPTPRSYSERVSERNRKLVDEYGDMKTAIGRLSFDQLMGAIPKYQEGGEVMMSEDPNDPLQIDMRQADPSMYEGSVLGGGMEQDPLQIDERMANPEMYEGSTLGVDTDPLIVESEMLEEEMMQNQMMQKELVADRARKALEYIRVVSELRGTAQALDSPDGRSGVEVMPRFMGSGYLEPMPFREPRAFPNPYKNKVN
jgi:hypothetical protein